MANSEKFDDFRRKMNLNTKGGNEREVGNTEGEIRETEGTMRKKDDEGRERVRYEVRPSSIFGIE